MPLQSTSNELAVFVESEENGNAVFSEEKNNSFNSEHAKRMYGSNLKRKPMFLRL